MEEIKKEKRVKPIVIEVISSGEKRVMQPMGEKNYVEIRVPVADGHIRCIVLRDYEGMIDMHYIGDIVDLPERRYKSLSFRGFVEEYKGTRAPNKMR